MKLDWTLWMSGLLAAPEACIGPLAPPVNVTFWTFSTKFPE